MTVPALTLAQIRKLKPCADDWTRVQTLLKAHGKGPYSAADAKAAGVTLDNLIWIAEAVAKTDKDVGCRLRLWAADCAARVLHIYERNYLGDPRPRAAINAARDYARGRIEAAARHAAWAAAWDASRAASRAAAWRAASRAAAWSAWAAAYDAAWAASYDAAWAASSDAAWAASRDAAKAAEQKWQFDRLVAWLSDPEPEDWPLEQKEDAA